MWTKKLVEIFQHSVVQIITLAYFIYRMLYNYLIDDRIILYVKTKKNFYQLISLLAKVAYIIN